MHTHAHPLLPQGEAEATVVSDAIPFIEYDLHRQLIYKLR